MRAMLAKILANISDRNIGISGAILGVVGIALSIYFYIATIAERRPIFLLDDTSRAVIASKQEIADSAIAVTRRDGKPITKDVNIAKFYFWNDGSLPIKHDEVLKPIRVYVENGEILSFKLLRITREVTGAKAVQSAPDSLILSASILEPSDGLSGQIIYEGPRDAKIKLEGVIQGVGAIEFCSCLVPKKPWFLLLSSVIYVALLAVILRDLISHWRNKMAENKRKLVTLTAASLLLVGLVFSSLYRLHQFSKISADPPESLVAKDPIH